MRPWVAKLRRGVHAVGIHGIEGEAAVVTTLVINDHSHGDGFSKMLCESSLSQRYRSSGEDLFTANPENWNDEDDPAGS